MRNRLVIPTLGLLALLVAAPCLAMDAVGTYHYAEPGYTGTMTISRSGPAFVFRFITTSQSNGQMCDFQTWETPIDQGGGRIVDTLPAMGGTEDDGIRFSIGFRGSNAYVDVQSKGMECGMSGYFGGHYVKIR